MTSAGWCRGAGGTCHGPVGLPHVLLHQDEADEADAAVHQPHQQAGHSKDLVAGGKGRHVAKEHLEEQAWPGREEHLQVTSPALFSFLFLQFGLVSLSLSSLFCLVQHCATKNHHLYLPSSCSSVGFQGCSSLNGCCFVVCSASRSLD